ncbi:MAG: hypothetical protein IKJ31_04395 [Bacteroidaceae bacterium]|nr:hypothetical protein [Bacteroidaceae bacterium]
MQKWPLIFLFAVLSFSCSKKESGEWHPELIAHAAGVIDGYTYTNSREAFDRAVKNGYRFIEFDFSFTADSVLVATHTWREYNVAVGCEHRGDSAPLSADFISQKLYGRYTTLTAEQVNKLFEENENLILVTDIMSDADILERYFPLLKERMVVEAFSYKDYIELKHRGYFRVLYSCLAKDLEQTIVRHMLLHHFFDGEKVEWIALHASAFNNVLFKFVNTLCSLKIALFTVNNISEVPCKYRDNIEMLYTDTILPLK